MPVEQNLTSPSNHFWEKVATGSILPTPEQLSSLPSRLTPEELRAATEQARQELLTLRQANSHGQRA